MKTDFICSNKNTGHRNSSLWLGMAMTLACGIALLLFFLFCYPYHLRHREQTMLFISNWDWIRETYFSIPRTTGGPVRLAGDWLQQWFYYIGAGPLIVSLLLTSLGVCWFHIVKRIGELFSSRGNIISLIAYMTALLVVLWEAGRECLPEYPVASTLQILGWSSLLLFILGTRGWNAGQRGGLLVLCCIAGYLLFGFQPLPQTKAWGKPDMNLERQMGLDVEASFGHWKQVREMTADDADYNLDIFYRNLALAQDGRLADSLLYRNQNGVDGLFIPVDENGNYFLFSAAGEAWWAVGDMTMAEHATLLGFIFSPRHTGSRDLRRLAEINLAKGDNAAAEKYLRLLEQSPVHRSWAKHLRKENARHPKVTSLNSPKSLDSLKSLNHADTLRLQGEVQLCLRGLLDQKPSNELAKQYLLCYDLLAQDLWSFANDVQHYGCPTGIRVYEEAMLVIMASRPEMRELWQTLIREKTYKDFMAFNNAFGQTQGQLQPLRKQFGKTYWFYLKAHSPK